MERSVTVRTPESIAFYYELAGLGSRFLALAIDTVIQWLLVVIIVILGSLAAGRAADIAGALHLSQKNIGSTVIALIVLVIFLLGYGYFMLFEQIWNGQTPGKRALGIRVVADGGYPVSFLDSVIRNLVRIPEQLLGFYALSIISMLLSSQNKRLGDFAAGTIVVRDRAFEVPDPESWLRQTQEAALQDGAAVGALNSDELALVDRYIERRTLLAPQAAQQSAAKIAAALRPRLGAAAQGLSDDELLVKIAARQLR